MVERSKWKYGNTFKVGHTVMLRTDFDNNTQTRKRALQENLDTNVYKVRKIDNLNNASIQTEGKCCLKGIATNRFKKIFIYKL